MMKRNSRYISIGVVLLLAAVLATGCYRGRPSEKPPVHVNPNMDSQPKYLPQATSEFFDNGSAMRLPVPGTVARGELRDNLEYYTGKDISGNFVKQIPLPIEVTMQTLKRGQDRYNIYCSPCHGRLGDGKGIMIQRGYVPPPTLHDDRIRNYTDGQLFDVVTNGIRNMPSYALQVPVSDRWAIIAYLRALQRSQAATLEDIPQQMREKVKQ